jgi:uncharacterized protein
VTSRRGAVAFLVGLVFSVGLALSGMTRPSKVQGFLDVAGSWDPSLAFVMGAALAITLVAFPLILRRARPVLGSSFHVPRATQVDKRLLAGAAIFGVGWGIAGYCPGPALVTAGSGAVPAGIFTVAMVAGMLAFARTARADDGS